MCLPLLPLLDRSLLPGIQSYLDLQAVAALGKSDFTGVVSQEEVNITTTTTQTPQEEAPILQCQPILSCLKTCCAQTVFTLCDGQHPRQLQTTTLKSFGKESHNALHPCPPEPPHIGTSQAHAGQQEGCIRPPATGLTTFWPYSGSAVSQLSP